VFLGAGALYLVVRRDLINIDVSRDYSLDINNQSAHTTYMNTTATNTTTEFSDDDLTIACMILGDDVSDDISDAETIARAALATETEICPQCGIEWAGDDTAPYTCTACRAGGPVNEVMTKARIRLTEHLAQYARAGCEHEVIALTVNYLPYRARVAEHTYTAHATLATIEASYAECVNAVNAVKGRIGRYFEVTTRQTAPVVPSTIPGRTNLAMHITMAFDTMPGAPIDR
jgi:hypothetical protein